MIYNSLTGTSAAAAISAAVAGSDCKSAAGRVIDIIDTYGTILTEKIIQSFLDKGFNTIGFEFYHIIRRLIQSHPQSGAASPHTLEKYNQTALFGAVFYCSL